MTSQIQSGIGLGPWQACVCVCVCVFVCVCKVGVKGEAYHRDKHSVASDGPSGWSKCTLPVWCLCPLTENWFISPVQADPSIGASLSVSSNCSVCHRSGWTADESTNILSGNLQWMLSSHNWQALWNPLVLKPEKTTVTAFVRDLPHISFKVQASVLSKTLCFTTMLKLMVMQHQIDLIGWTIDTQKNILQLFLELVNHL